ncbi:cupin domain-containing protein [Pelagibius sp. Alg239-R121]|uniref:cupin domain-containing protein n=1 Tax=Pelagibius sp. Alg239-R121 TaxID=2993448 RepID=UPI0024A652AD|nr:cupin domain-containing protein [Pelagibius sp. Alg239-R121]
MAAALGNMLGLERLGVNHETLPPGGRSSVPHAHSHEEEFVYVVSGCPDLWIDGDLHPLQPGDAAAFPAGTGIAHSVINNSKEEVRILIVGENHSADRVVYPVNPETPHSRPWRDAPSRPLGTHDGTAAPD